MIRKVNSQYRSQAKQVRVNYSARFEHRAPRAVRPNPRVQPTPLAASEIGAFLKARFVSKFVSIYRGSAADAQSVGPPSLCCYVKCVVYRHIYAVE